MGENREAKKGWRGGGRQYGEDEALAMLICQKREAIL